MCVLVHWCGWNMTCRSVLELMVQNSFCGWSYTFDVMLLYFDYLALFCCRVRPKIWSWRGMLIVLINCAGTQSIQSCLLLHQETGQCVYGMLEVSGILDFFSFLVCGYMFNPGCFHMMKGVSHSVCFRLLKNGWKKDERFWEPDDFLAFFAHV